MVNRSSGVRLNIGDNNNNNNINENNRNNNINSNNDPYNFQLDAVRAGSALSGRLPRYALILVWNWLYDRLMLENWENLEIIGREVGERNPNS